VLARAGAGSASPRLRGRSCFPDSIPDNIADLELRVDAGPGDQLIASVEAHNGERSASLEFLHYLKAPMVDFIRRPPEPSELGQAVHFPEPPVSFNAEPSIEDLELPAEAPQVAAKIVSPAAETPLDPELDPRFDIEEGARLISPLDPLPSLPVEPSSHLAVEASTIARPLAEPVAHPTMVRPTREPQRRDRFAGWFWRAALTFASVVLLALVVGFGMRRTGSGKRPGKRSGTNRGRGSVAARHKIGREYRPRAEGIASREDRRCRRRNFDRQHWDLTQAR
jgi:hypothetical protein